VVGRGARRSRGRRRHATPDGALVHCRRRNRLKRVEVVGRFSERHCAEDRPWLRRRLGLAISASAVEAAAQTAIVSGAAAVGYLVCTVENCEPWGDGEPGLVANWRGEMRLMLLRGAGTGGARCGSHRRLRLWHSATASSPARRGHPTLRAAGDGFDLSADRTAVLSGGCTSAGTDRGLQ
jgi:hypothetical protein